MSIRKYKRKTFVSIIAVFLFLSITSMAFGQIQVKVFVAAGGSSGNCPGSTYLEDIYGQGDGMQEAFTDIGFAVHPSYGLSFYPEWVTDPASGAWGCGGYDNWVDAWGNPYGLDAGMYAGIFSHGWCTTDGQSNGIATGNVDVSGNNFCTPTFGDHIRLGTGGGNDPNAEGRVLVTTACNSVPRWFIEPSPGQGTNWSSPFWGLDDGKTNNTFSMIAGYHGTGQAEASDKQDIKDYIYGVNNSNSGIGSDWLAIMHDESDHECAALTVFGDSDANADNFRDNGSWTNNIAPGVQRGTVRFSTLSWECINYWGAYINPGAANACLGKKK